MDTALPSIYRDPEHYDVLAQMTAPADLPLYRRLAGRYAGPVLEVGCGTGRVCLDLAAAGADVWGIDVARPLLDFARRKAAAAGLPVVLLEADCRTLELEQRFALILMPYNAFNAMLDACSIQECLQAVRRHMEPESRFVLDTFNPDPRALVADPEKRVKILEYIDPYTGERVVLSESNDYDAATQVNRITWTYDIGGRAAARIDELDMRIFFPQELDALLHYNGFTIEEKLGDYDGTPFATRRPKQIAICQLS